jgi:hypothetical protein
MNLRKWGFETIGSLHRWVMLIAIYNFATSSQLHRMPPVARRN